MTQEFKTPEAALAHYGVKGMKWGKRKARPSSADVQKARVSLKRDLGTLENKAAKVSLAKNATEKKKALKEVHEVANKAKNRNAVDIAARMTTGEKVATGILTGVFPAAGLGFAAGTKISHNRGKKRVNELLDSYANSTLDDYYDAS